MFYLLLSSYSLIFFAALGWAFFEFTIDFGIISQLAIGGVSLLFVIIASYIAWIFARAEQLREKFPPPIEDTNSKEYLDWQNKILDESFEHYSGKILFRNIAITCGIILLVLCLFGVVSYCVLK
jgi:hypothetical protein